MSIFTLEEFENQAYAPHGINKEFLDKWNNIKCVEERFTQTPLEWAWALRSRHLDVFKYLVENGADITTDPMILFRVIWSGRTDMIRLLVENGVDITIRNNRAIGEAASAGDLEMVKCLAGYGADITANDNWPVRVAVEEIHMGNYGQQNHWRVVKWLIKNGADINAANNKLIRWTAYRGCDFAVKWLIKHGADASCNNNVLVKEFRGYQANDRDVENLTCLEVLKCLVENRLDITAHDNHAIKEEISYNRVETVKYLLNTNIYTNEDIHSIPAHTDEIRELLTNYRQLSYTKACRKK